MRDARINQIGEGANEVLTSFIALVGMRGPGMEFKEIYDTMMKPSRDRMSKAWAAGKSRLGATIRVPDVPVLVIAATLDTSTTLEQNRSVARRFPHAQLVVLRNGGHPPGVFAGCVPDIYGRFIANYFASG